MDTQRYANQANLTLDQARVIKEVSEQYGDPQIMQIFSVLGNLKSNLHLNNMGLGMIGLTREKLLSVNIYDRFNMLMNHLKNFMKTATPEAQGRLNELLTQSFETSINEFKELTSYMNKKGIDFSAPMYNNLKQSERYLKKQDQQISPQEVFAPIFKNNIESTNKNLQRQQSDLFKVNVLAKVNEKTNNLLQGIHEKITNIYSLIHNISNRNALGIAMDIKTLFGNPTETIIPSHNKSQTITNKALQGDPQ
ncbi:hypothetical protein KVK26_04025 [Helicobacter pylori]|nr:hypothetical protein KVK26_04025 [Helicobacter pylori]